MDPGLPPLGWQTFVTQWEFRPVWDVLIVVALAAYVVGLRRAEARNGVPAVTGWRVAAWIGGLALLVITLNSSIEKYAYVLFWMHMVQHLLLIMVLPAILIVGSPLTVWVAASTPAHADRIRAFLRSGPISVLTHPGFGFAVYAAVIVFTHLTNFMDNMMTSTSLAPIEQVMYLGSGYLFLLGIVGREPIRWNPPQLMRIFLLIIGMLPDTVVGIVLLQTDHNLFPVMLGHGPSWAMDATADQNLGGGIMWAMGDGVMMCIALGLVIALITSPNRQDIVGSFLEGVRRESLRERTEGSDDTFRGIGETTDVDSDEDALAAYNRMLARMNNRA